jgi:hypothetical protein
MRFISKANAYYEAVVCAVLSAGLGAHTMFSAEDSGRYNRRQPAAFAEATACQGAVALQSENGSSCCFNLRDA